MQGTSPESGSTTPEPRELIHLGRSSGPTLLLEMIAVVIALVLALASYLILTGLTSITPTHNVVVTVLALDLVFVLILLPIVIWQIWRLSSASRRQIAGARLHLRIVALFSIIAVLPAMILAVSSSIGFDRALSQLFSKRVKEIVRNSLDVANTYLLEHGAVIRADIVAMARDLDSSAELMTSEPEEFKTLFAAQAGLRNLPLAYIINDKGERILELEQAKSAPYIAPPAGAIADAAAGQAVVIAPGERAYRVGAVYKLQKIPNAFLYVSRPVDGRAVEHLNRAQAGVDQYSRLEERRTGMQFAYGVMYITLALTLLLVAIWLGLWFANRLVSPIRRLITAAQAVSAGNLNAQVTVRRGEGDIGQLATTFNRMTSQLRTQRDALISTNSQLEERRRFTEAVLSGVSAGVLGLDAEGVVTLANKSAEQLLERTSAELLGKKLSEVVPEMSGLLSPRSETPHHSRRQEQLTLLVKNVERTFAVRVTGEQSGEGANGAVLTFDDITELVSAQRTAAWADVARRIAHEIKNPLTPIQLSAERLKRKYGSHIREEREVFDKSIDSIVRNVGHIGRMVSEFSNFARMPKAELQARDLNRVVREAVALYEVGSDIEVRILTGDSPIMMALDQGMIGQALTNLVKNATEAIQAVTEAPGAPEGYKGRIEVGVRAEAGEAIVDVIDNGIGLPKQNRGRLVEPYVTTRAKGTGLGLAIVQKIVAEHGGSLSLEDAPPDAAGSERRGAMIRIRLPIRAATSAGPPAAGATAMPGAAVAAMQ